MTGEQGAGPPLPADVPREFADAYRAAFEAALAAQAEQEPGTHAQRKQRRVPPVEVGAGALTPGTREDDLPVVERVRRSGWFVASLLALLVLVMLVGAYVVGRLFASHVGA